MRPLTSKNRFFRSITTRHGSLHVHRKLREWRDLVVSLTISRGPQEPEHHLPQDPGSSHLPKAADQAQDC